MYQCYCWLTLFVWLLVNNYKLKHYCNHAFKIINVLPQISYFKSTGLLYNIVNIMKILKGNSTYFIPWVITSLWLKWVAPVKKSPIISANFLNWRNVMGKKITAKNFRVSVFPYDFDMHMNSVMSNSRWSEKKSNTSCNFSIVPSDYLDDLFLILTYSIWRTSHNCKKVILETNF